ncbi:MAG: hypothetical protein K8U03_15200 [Planctomycetia bacterium]|nr:hypothetical protein [Planctomycetia bacterium]
MGIPTSYGMVLMVRLRRAALEISGSIASASEELGNQTRQPGSCDTGLLIAIDY